MKVIQKSIHLMLMVTAAAVLSSCAQHNTSNPSDSTANTALTIVSEEATPTPTDIPTPTPTASPAPTLSPTEAPLPTVPPAEETKSTTAPVTTPSDGIDWYNGYADPRTIDAEMVSNPSDLTVLVNKYYEMPADYAPTLVLADSSDSQYLRTEADDAWDALRAACETDTGIVLYLCSGYRTYEAQATLFATSVKKRGIEHACSKNALEGRSEHNLGLAIDISTNDVQEISSKFAETTAGAWVGEHCHEYGFILRYMNGKSSITGYAYEPWHYRYVGIDLASTLYASGQTLEEYYGKVPVVP
jgi:D-alanyl-D-alanine carboxypeptidase